MLHSFTSWLASIDPAAPAAALLAFVFTAIYSVRRWWPSGWLWIESKVPFADSFDTGWFASLIWKTVQALPGMLLGAATAALSSGGSIKASLLGVLAGLGASLAHELMAHYKGAVGQPRDKSGSGGASADVIHITLTPDARIPSNPPPAALRSLLLACLVLGCSPAATQRAEAAGAAAAECLANPAVKACLDLCRSPVDAGSDQ